MLMVYFVNENTYERRAMDTELYYRYISCLLEHDNLTKAAKALGISQPALSSWLSNLEKKIGFQIFDRKSTPLKPTEEGELYIECIQKQQLLWQECQRKIVDIQQVQAGQVVIGAPAVYAKAVLASAAARFRASYPECKIVMKEATLPELIEKSRKGEVDCFISTSGTLSDEYELQELGMERIYLCIPKAWEINEKLKAYRILPGESGACFDYQMLKNQEFIFLEQTQPLQREMEKLFQENDFFPKSYLKANQVSIAIKLASLGCGITFASEEAIRGSGHMDDLCIYSLPPYIAGRMIYVAHEKERYLPDMCSKFIDVLKIEMKEQRWDRND